jgi:Ca2+-binding RTX toxin-like protein
MKSLLNWFKQRTSSRPAARRGTATLQLERLQDRWVPATLGVTKSAMLDFGGDYLSSSDLSEGGWAGYAGTDLYSFDSLFNSSRPWLDLDGNAYVDSDDAALAVERIMNKVRMDYAPYRVGVSEKDQDDAQAYLTNAVVGDAIVMITGSISQDLIPDLDAWGVAPWIDAGNDRDEIVFVFAGGSVDSPVFGDGSDRADRWFNQVARTISHELGHAFGLGHEVADPLGDADPITHSIMGTPPVERDWTRDFNFHDREYTTEQGTSQNAHRHLLQEDILGHSDNTWMAVLQPGVLTVSGNSAANTIDVEQAPNDLWVVSIDGTGQFVHLHSFNVGSLNPFDQDIVSLQIHGEAGDDSLAVGETFSAASTIYGGDGDDTLYGGVRADRLYGQRGNDVLHGRGGDDFLAGGFGRFDAGLDFHWSDNGTDTLYGDGGNDRLHGEGGNDFLYGGSGVDSLHGGSGDDHLYGGDDNDYLYGQEGLDRLFGQAGSDYLDGGADGIADLLFGGSGADVFKAERLFRLGGVLRPNLDQPLDYNFVEGDSIV